MSGSIVIVARNNLALTKATVRTAMAQTVPCEVVVVDNQSTDGTIDWLKTKTCGHLSLSKQMSLSFCWNLGMGTFFGLGRSKVLVCNNDVELPPYYYESLEALNKQFVTGVSVNDRGQVPVDPPTDLLNWGSPHPDFSAFMISDSVVDKVGWFDEEYFPAYCEDADYHVRMHRAGISAGSVPLPFYHERSQTIKNADEGEKARILRGADHCREKFRRKYGCTPMEEGYNELFNPRGSNS